MGSLDCSRVTGETWEDLTLESTGTNGEERIGTSWIGTCAVRMHCFIVSPPLSTVHPLEI